MRTTNCRSFLLAITLGASALPAAQALAADEDGKESSFLFVPYPITEPALGNGLLAGPVWMRPGPKWTGGIEKLQAIGAGALWTDGGSRGFIAFDHRAWRDGRWRSTAILADAEIHLAYPGLVPGEESGEAFVLETRGVRVGLDRLLAGGKDTLGLNLWSMRASVDFGLGLPPELAGEATRAQLNGVSLAWTHDSRDHAYLPTRGQAVSIAGTLYDEALGASFDASALRVAWTGYRPLPGKLVLGARALHERSSGATPFYLRPYVSLRGVAALSVSGDQATSVELEVRRRVSRRMHLLAFGGRGRASAVLGSKMVGAGGLGFRFEAAKYFGLTFGVDFARGPDGQVTYIQIGNAWSR